MRLGLTVRLPQCDPFPKIRFRKFRIERNGMIQILQRGINAPTHGGRKIVVAHSAADISKRQLVVKRNRFLDFVACTLAVLQGAKKGISRDHLSAGCAENPVIFGTVGIGGDRLLRFAHTCFGVCLGLSLIVHLGRNFRSVGVSKRSLVCRFAIWGRALQLRNGAVEGREILCVASSRDPG